MTARLERIIWLGLLLGALYLGWHLWLAYVVHMSPEAWFAHVRHSIESMLPVLPGGGASR